MPGPALYLLAVVGTLAAGVAFKEFVYEPHIAPRIEIWAENFLARREARKRAKEGIAVRSEHRNNSNERLIDGYYDERTDIELEKLVAKEVDNWRSQVTTAGPSTLRQRGSERRQSSSTSLPWAPISPTHVIFDIRSPPSTERTNSPRLPTPAPSTTASERASRFHTPETSMPNNNDNTDIEALNIDLLSASASSNNSSRAHSPSAVPSLSSNYLSAARPPSASSDLDFLSLSSREGSVASSNPGSIHSLSRTPSEISDDFGSEISASMSSWTSGGIRP